MSKQATLELLNSNAAKYRKAYSRKAKGELLKQLMELTGYKSSKSIIRYYSRTRKRKRVEKRGRLPKLHANDIELIKTIWLKSDQPCGKRLQPMLPTWLKAYSKRHEIDEEVQRLILSVSPATLEKRTRKSVTYVVELKCYPCEWRAGSCVTPAPRRILKGNPVKRW